MKEILQEIDKAFQEIKDLEEIKKKIKISPEEHFSLLEIGERRFLVDKNIILPEILYYLDKKAKLLRKQIEEEFLSLELNLSKPVYISVEENSLIIKDIQGEKIAELKVFKEGDSIKISTGRYIISLDLLKQSFPLLTEILQVIK